MPRGQLLCTIQLVQKRRKARFRTTAEKHRFRDGLVKAVPCPVRTAVKRRAASRKEKRSHGSGRKQQNKGVGGSEQGFFFKDSLKRGVMEVE